MTAETLRNYTLKDLAQLAKKRGVSGWHAMRKAQLVRALLKTAQKSAAAKTKKRVPPRRPTVRIAASATRRSAARPRVTAKPKRPAVLKRIEAARAKHERLKNLALYTSRSAPNGFAKDRLVVMVRDPYWLHAYWELTRQGVTRAQAAMGQDWHTARPVLRLMEISGGGTRSPGESLARTIEIHGGVNNWYIDVTDPPKSYRVDIGYQSASGKFFLLARSNIVHTPPAGSSDSLDENWTHVAENFDKIYAMSGGYDETGTSGELQELFEERLRRPMGSPMTTRYGAGLNGFAKKPEFHFEVDAELIVYGTTKPDAHVTLQGEPVRVRPDGTFTVRYSMPNCRQVIPAVACSVDGMEQRTIVLAVERNTKTMEPVTRDNAE
jgi:hypothetical protein